MVCLVTLAVAEALPAVCYINVLPRLLMESDKGETFIVDTSNILFILSGAFVGLDKIINTRIGKGVSLTRNSSKSDRAVDGFWRRATVPVVRPIELGSIQYTTAVNLEPHDDGSAQLRPHS